MKKILSILAAIGAVIGPTRAAQTNDLPPLVEVLQRAVARADAENKNDEQFHRHYHYARTRLREFRNAKGELKKREEKRNDGGVALDATARPPTSAAKPAVKDAPVSDTHSNVRGKPVAMNDFSRALLERFDFTLVGREMNNNRATLVLDFQPKKMKLPERSFKDKFINKAAGRAWVDEADAAVAKAELYLTDRVNVLGGLVGAVWKFTYSFDRARTPEGWWYARQVDWHLEGREVLVNRVVDYHEQKTDAVKVFEVAR